jgi:hypothetical protein
LRFSKSGDPGIERAYRTHYVSPELPEKKQEKLREKLSKAPELVVFDIYKESKCSECGAELAKGSFLVMEAERPLCLECADLDHLIYLPRGDATLTRRARNAGRRIDEDEKMTTAFAAKILDLFPRCPPEEATVRLAVIASVRHRHTRYDEILMATADRAEARAQVRDEINEILRAWAPPETGET